MREGKIAVVGLGKLGLPLAVTLAKGYEVIGIDTNQALVDSIKQGKFHSHEEGLDTFLKKSLKEQLLEVTTDISKIQDTTVAFVIVPTPSASNGSFDLSIMTKALEGIGKQLKTMPVGYLINIVSTVLPGDTKSYLIPTLEDFSGKKHGVDFDVCYNPEFIALGQVLNDLNCPDNIIIGTDSEKAFERLMDIYNSSIVIDIETKINRVTIPEAEIAKISINSMLTCKITYANMISNLCEKIENVNVDHVTKAIGSDPRIGTRYLTGGLGYGGPCFPRDNCAFEFSMKKNKAWSNGIPGTIHNFNREVPVNLTLLIRRVSHECFNSRPVNIGIWGVAYRDGTDVIEQSQAIEFIDSVSNFSECKSIQVYLGIVKEDDFRRYAQDNLFHKDLDIVEIVQTQKELLENDVIILPVKLGKYMLQDSLDNLCQYDLPKYLKENNKYIIDPWRQLKASDNVIQFGIHHPVMDVRLNHWKD